MRLVLYTGKGGVGKTTTAAAAAVRAAELGRRTLVASVDAAHSLGDVFECPLGPEPVEVAPKLAAVEIDARAEAARHWGRVQDYLAALFVHQGLDAAVSEEVAQLPGAEELTALLAVEDAASRGAYDLVVVDCAPTAAALRLVTLPDVARGMLRVALGMLRTLSGVAAPMARRLVAVPLPDAAVFETVETLLYRELTALRRRLTQASTSVRLVVTPERMVIDEARRARTDLALFEVPCDAVVLNRLLPEEAALEPLFREQVQRQRERLREIEAFFHPLPVLTAPLQDDEVCGLSRLAEHGRALFRGVPPDAILCRTPGLRFEGGGQAPVLRLPLPGVAAEELDVVKIEDELVVTTPTRRRAIPLPRRLAGLRLAEARLAGGELWVRFGPEASPCG